VSTYTGRVAVRPQEPGAITGGERIVDAGAKNVTEGLTVRVAN
jgi:hypothetical protein